MEYWGFYLIILISNIIQGITGFAGTILAMPFSIMLVGYDTAKPVLNVLGLLAGIYILIGNKDKVVWSEVRKIIAIMAVGIFLGFFLKSIFMDQEDILYKMLGIFIIFVSARGLISLYIKDKDDENEKKKESAIKSYLTLSIAGIVHGIFVSGGPLLINYLTKKIDDKTAFRATISTVWIALNTLILIDDIKCGLWTEHLVKVQLISIPFMLIGMLIGGILYKKMSQILFMRVTYILLFVSGLSLIFK